MSRPVKEKTDRRRRPLAAALVLAAVVALALLGGWMLFIEPGWIEVTEHELGFEHLDIDSGSIRVVQLADFHCASHAPPPFIQKAVRLANAQNPDLIALTGDFISRNRAYAQPCAEALARLQAPYGVFAVLGNHDHWLGPDAVTKALTEAGITVLTNRSINIHGNLWLIGIDDSWTGRPDNEAAFRDVPDDAFELVITHSPRTFPELAGRRSLVLTAHTHGGQVRVPFIPRNRIPGIKDSRYLFGWFEEGRARMYVNRGLGTTVVPVRFLSRPEISVFTLKGADPAKP